MLFKYKKQNRKQYEHKATTPDNKRSLPARNFGEPVITRQAAFNRSHPQFISYPLTV